LKPFLLFIFGATAAVLLYGQREFARDILKSRYELSRRPFPEFQYPKTRDCVAQSPWQGSMQTGKACLTKAIPLLAGYSQPRLTELLNVAYPERLRPENLRENLLLGPYRKGYRVLGNGFPIFFFTDGVEPLDSSPAGLRAMIDRYETDPAPPAFLEGPEVRPSTTLLPLTPQPGASLNRVELRLTAPRAGYLVRSENFSPLWSVRIDGKPGGIVAANGAFQAVPLSQGVHTVVFEFQTLYPLWFWIHQIAVFCLLGLCLIPSLQIQPAALDLARRAC
jgi:hypothetical protein